MDDYYYFFFFYSQGGSSDSPERRGMRGICSTTTSAVTVRAPSGLRDGTVVSVSRRHRRAGLLIHHAGVLDAGRVLRLKINLVSYLRWCVARAREAFAIAAWHLRKTFNDAGGGPGLV